MDYPERNGDSWWTGNISNSSGHIILDAGQYTDIMLDDDPVEVELIIKRK